VSERSVERKPVAAAVTARQAPAVAANATSTRATSTRATPADTPASTRATSTRATPADTPAPYAAVEPVPVSDFDAGFLVGLLVGEGHFGGDGRQPQVTLRMHTDHEALFRWLMSRFPESRLYGPYDHSGRRYYQWMARGPVLRERIVPLIDAWLQPHHSARVWARYQHMKATYRLGSGADGSSR